MIWFKPSLAEGFTASVRSRISELPMITLRMLLKSWAIPPASVPMASIFWA